MKTIATAASKVKRTRRPLPKSQTLNPAPVPDPVEDRTVDGIAMRLNDSIAKMTVIRRLLASESDAITLDGGERQGIVAMLDEIHGVMGAGCDILCAVEHEDATPAVTQ